MRSCVLARECPGKGRGHGQHLTALRRCKTSLMAEPPFMEMFKAYGRYWLSSGIATMEAVIITRLCLNIKTKGRVFSKFAQLYIGILLKGKLPHPEREIAFRIDGVKQLLEPFFSDVHFCCRYRIFSIFCSDRRNHLGDELVNLLRRAADVLRGIGHGGQVDFGKCRVGGQPL